MDKPIRDLRELANRLHEEYEEFDIDDGNWVWNHIANVAAELLLGDHGMQPARVERED